MERAQTSDPRLVHWSEHLPGGNLPHAPAWLWVGVTGGILVVFVLLEVMFGDLALAWRGGSAEDPWNLETTVELAVLIGFLICTSRWALDGTRRDLDHLRPLLRCSPLEFEASARRLYVYDRRWISLCVSFAVLVGLAMIPLSEGDLTLFLSPEAWGYKLAFAITVNTVLFSVMGRELWVTVEITRVFSDLGKRLGPVDLLNPRALAPFAHRGLRSAVFWIGGSCIASLLVLGPNMLPATAVIAATMAIGTAALFLPTREVHSRLRAEKEAELARVRDAIRGEREGLLPSDATGVSASAGTRLPGLLAYEARIASASVWPFDAPTVVRFLLLLALALGSWIGGAVVEQILSTVLD